MAETFDARVRADWIVTEAVAQLRFDDPNDQDNLRRAIANALRDAYHIGRRHAYIDAQNMLAGNKSSQEPLPSPPVTMGGIEA